MSLLGRLLNKGKTKKGKARSSLELLGYLDSIIEQKNTSMNLFFSNVSWKTEKKELKDIIAAIKAQNAILKDFESLVNGRIKPHKDFKEEMGKIAITARLRSTEVINDLNAILEKTEDRDALPIVNKALKETILPTTLGKGSLASELSQDLERLEAIEKDGLSKKWIPSYKTNLERQKALFQFIKSNAPKLDKVEDKIGLVRKVKDKDNNIIIAICRNLLVEESRILTSLASSEQTILGNLEQIKKRRTKLQQVHVENENRFLAFLRMLAATGVLTAVYLTSSIVISRATAPTRAEIQKIYNKYAKTTIGEAVAKLEKEGLPKEYEAKIKENLLQATQNAAEEAIGDKKVKNVEFEKIVNAVLDITGEYLYNEFENEFEAEIARLRNDGLDVELGIEKQVIKDRINSTLAYYLPMLLEMMDKYVDNSGKSLKEKFFDWLKKGSGMPINVVQLEQEVIMKAVDNQLQQLGTEISRAVYQMAREVITLGVAKARKEEIELIKERKASTETVSDKIINTVAENLTFMILGFAMLVILSFIRPISLAFKPIRNIAFYAVKGFPRDLKILLAGGYKIKKQ